MTETEKIMKQLQERTLLAGKKIKDVELTKISTGIPTGLFELDYRIGGFRKGWYVVFTGATGDGKTTVTREFVLSAAANKVKTFYFVGEESLETEMRNMSRVGAIPDEIVPVDGLAGRKYYAPKDMRYSKFQDYFDDWITLESYYVVSDLIEKTKGLTMESVVIDTDMERAARNGVKFFVLDNLSTLTEGGMGSNIFDIQRRIVRKVKRFVRKHNVTVLLVTHPNESGKAVGGIGEISNHADCVFQIKRLREGDQKEKLLAGLPLTVQEKASGILTITKAREDGMLGKIPLMWDKERGALLNVTTMEGAMEYELNGWWTKSVAPF